MVELTPVYVNHKRVRLQGDPQPQVKKIVIVTGREPEMVRVFRLQSKDDPEGAPLSIEEFIDRTQPEEAVWLKLIEMEETGAGKPQVEPEETWPAGTAMEPQEGPRMSTRTHGPPDPGPKPGSGLAPGHEPPGTESTPTRRNPKTA